MRAAVACLPLALSAPAVLADVPEFHSTPGAAHTLYLDFDGHQQASSQFSCIDPSTGVAIMQTLPAIDVAPPAAPLGQLVPDLWEAVAEDFAPFDVDVTTVEPPVLHGDDPVTTANRALRVVIGRSAEPFGGGNLGWAPPTCFGRAPYARDDVPNTVVVDTTIGGQYSDARQRARAASHEAGHLLGLAHYAGAGNPSAPSAPIMHTARHPLYRWASGTDEFGGWQDDLTQLDMLLGRRTDDHGDSAADASIMAQVDAARVHGAGVIEDEADWDYWTFRVTGAGQVQIRFIGGAGVDPATLLEGTEPNLHPALVLTDARGNLLAQGSYFSMPALAPNELAVPGAPPSLRAGEYYQLAIHSRGGDGNVGHFNLAVDGPVADLSGPRVLETATNCLADGLHTLRIRFDQPVWLPQHRLFKPSDWVSVQGPNGDVSVTSIQPLDPGDPTPREFIVSLATQLAAGYYDVRIGPEIQGFGLDPDNRPYWMDQDDDGINGEVDDAHVFSVHLVADGRYACMGGAEAEVPLQR